MGEVGHAAQDVDLVAMERSGPGKVRVHEHAECPQGQEQRGAAAGTRQSHRATLTQADAEVLPVLNPQHGWGRNARRSDRINRSVPLWLCQRSRVGSAETCVP